MKTKSVREHYIKQRFAVKVLRYYVGDQHPEGRNTDPVATHASRIGMSMPMAQQQKEKIRDLILIAADNIRAGRE
jgi:hypothetical protein